MPELSGLLPMVGLLLLVGAFAGVVAGLLGVGGGIILVPAFYFVFSALGYSGDGLMQICLATSLATIVVTSIRSVLAHHRKGAVDWDILRDWWPGITFGALVGMATAGHLRGVVLMVIFGVLGVLVGLYLAFGRPHWRLGDAMPSGPRLYVMSPILGVLSVLMGIGGGSFGVPLMTLYGRPIHRAVATASGFGVIIAIPSVTGFLLGPVASGLRPPFMVGQVNVVAFVLIVSMTMLTTPFGVRLAHGLDPKPLRRVFAVFIIVMALNMLRRAWLM